MNANNGFARRAIILYCCCASIVAMLAMSATTVIEAQGEGTATPPATKSADEKSATPEGSAPAEKTSPVEPETPKQEDMVPSEVAEEGMPDPVAKAGEEASEKTSSDLDADKIAADDKTSQNKDGEKPSKDKPTKEKSAEEEKPALKISTTRAFDKAHPEMAKILRKRGSLTLKNTSLKEALFTINEVWKVNINVGQDVEGSVDSTFKDTALYEILENILTVNGYGFQIIGMTLSVAKSDQLPDHPMFETQIIELRAADTKEIFQIVKYKLSQRGRIDELAASKALLITDFPERIEEVRSLAKQFDDSVAKRKGIEDEKTAAKKKDEEEKRNAATGNVGANPNPNNSTPGQKPEDMKVVQLILKNLKGASVIATLDSMKSRDGKINFIQQDNKLVVVDYPDKLEAIEKFVKEMDASASEPKRAQYQLKYKKVAALLDLVKGMLSAEGKMTPFEAENRLMVVDYPRVLEEVEKLIEELDTPASATSVAQFKLKFVKVASIVGSAQALLSKDGRLAGQEADNTLAVSDYPSNIKQVEDLIARTDVQDNGTTIGQYNLQYARASMLGAVVQSMLSKEGRFSVNDQSNTILVEDYPHIQSKIAEMVRESDTEASQPQFLSVRLEYVDAKELLESLQGLLSKDGKISAVVSENQINVVDYPIRLKDIQKRIAETDRMQPQVRITTLIYDMSVEDVLNLGMNFRSGNKGNYGSGTTPNTVLGVDSIVRAPFQTTANIGSTANPAGLLTLMTLSRGFDLTSTITALSTCKNSRLLADPSISVIDRRKGLIKIVQEIPILQQAQSNGVTTTTPTFKEAGISLEVTPRISLGDRNIQMNVKPTFSRAVGFTQGSPIIEKREAETTVWVAEHQTFVLGGLRQRNELSEDRGIPYLKDIKKFHFNKLFSYQENTYRESELVVFLNPEIVTPEYCGRNREQVISSYGQEGLDSIATPQGKLPYDFENGDPSQVRIIENPSGDHVPTPAPSAKKTTGYGKQAAANSKAPATKKAEDKTAVNEDRFNKGHGDKWGRTAADRAKFPSQNEVLTGKPDVKNTQPAATAIAKNSSHLPPPVQTSTVAKSRSAGNVVGAPVVRLPSTDEEPATHTPVSSRRPAPPAQPKTERTAKAPTVQQVSDSNLLMKAEQQPQLTAAPSSSPPPTTTGGSPAPASTQTGLRTFIKVR